MGPLEILLVLVVVAAPLVGLLLVVRLVRRRLGRRR
jgi:hypothetical protein